VGGEGTSYLRCAGIWRYHFCSSKSELDTVEKDMEFAERSI
jgi:hypothetical protein